MVCSRVGYSVLSASILPTSTVYFPLLNAIGCTDDYSCCSVLANLVAGQKEPYALLDSAGRDFVVTCLASFGHVAHSMLTLAGVTILSLSQVRQQILAGLVFLIVGIPAYISYSRFVGLDTFIWVYIAQTLIPLLAVILFAQQVNAQTRTQNLLNELAESHHQLEAYADQVEELTLTNERHGCLSCTIPHKDWHHPVLTAIRISSGQTEQVQTIIHQAMARARATLAESRQVIDHLRKDTRSSQDDLSNIIKEEVEHFSTSTGIPVTLRLGTEVFVPFPQRDCACRAAAGRCHTRACRRARCGSTSHDQRHD
jgi:NarL family two-component system sensor histidine kinase YdfH